MIKKLIFDLLILTCEVDINVYLTWITNVLQRGEEKRQQ